MSTAFRRPTICSMIVDMHCIAAGGISCVLLPKIWLGVFQDGFGKCSWKGGGTLIPMPLRAGGGRVQWVSPHAFGKFTMEPCGGCKAGGGGTMGCKGGAGGCQAGGGGKAWGFLAIHASPLGPSGTPHRWRRYLGGQSAHTHTSIYIYPHRHTYIFIWIRSADYNVTLLVKHHMCVMHT